jgi:hypothetical protein
MQAYPGYTVGKIEEELSYRQLEELSKQWNRGDTASMNIKVLMQMVAGFMGVDLKRVFKPTETTIDDTIEMFRLEGLI